MAGYDRDAKLANLAKARDARKAKRGQPDGNADAAFIDPVEAGIAAGEPAEPTERTKRGRPAGAAGGGTGAGKATSASLDVSTAIGLIQGGHAVVAGLSRQPHWFIDDADAKRFGQAMANAARHFPLRATQKALDVTMLIITAVSIEAPRIAMSMQIARGVRRQAPPRGPAQVFQFYPPNAPSPAPPQAESAGAPAAAPAADAPHDVSSDMGSIGGGAAE